MIKNYKLISQRSSTSPKQKSIKRTSPRHLMIKLLKKTNDKKMLKAARRKKKNRLCAEEQR